MTKRIPALLTALALSLSCALFSSCGEKKPELSRVSHVYKSTDVALPENLSISGFFKTTDGVFANATESASRADGSMYLKHSLLKIDTETGAYEKSPLELGSEDESIICMSFTPDGLPLAVIGIYDEETFSSVYSLRLLTEGGGEVLCEDIVKAIFSDVDPGARINISNMTVDSQGNIYLLTRDTLAVFDSDVKLRFTLEIESGGVGIGIGNDGLCYVSYRNEEHKMTASYVDLAAKILSEQIAFPDGYDIQNANVCFAPGYDFFFSTDEAVYGWNIGEPAPTELCNWINSDIIRHEISRFLIIDADNIIAYSNKYNQETEINLREMYLLRRIPDDEIPEKYVINFAVMYPDSDFAAKIVRFNRNSELYRVAITDYGIIPSGDEQLSTEILAGNVPDIIYVDRFENADEWINKGLFVDLNTFFERDEEFTRELFFDNLLEAFERGGKLYTLPELVNLRTLIGKTGSVPESWTVDEFVRYAQSLDETVFLEMYITRAPDILSLMLKLSLDRYIDFEKATCDITPEGFGTLLELAKKLDKGVDSYQDSLSGDDLADLRSDRSIAYREGNVLLKTATVHQISDLVSNMTSFGTGDAALVGYPNDSGSGCELVGSNMLAISKSSLVKEGAWELLKSLMYDNRSSTSMRGFVRGFSPIYSVFRENAELECTQHYYFRFGTGYSASSREMDPSRYDPQKGVIRDLTETDIERVEAAIVSARVITPSERAIMDMILEEADIYFAGEKSLDETVKVIENRVSTYISENSLLFR